jgi:uncharacterized membrane protein
VTAAAIVLVALVADDPAVLRNAPRDDAPAQATLWRGDWLEVRGETAGFLRVYDHRHERPGYIRPTIVRVHRLEAASAPELTAVVRFLRDASGSESLGIGYAALALRAAPAGADSSEILGAIGTMADRLARRASAARADARNATLTAHIEVAESYGVKFKSVDVPATGNGTGAAAQRARLCYDGEAWEGVLAARAAAPIERARAALALASAGRACQDRTTLALEPTEARAWNDRRLQALQSIEYPAEAALAPALLGRVRLRRAEALAWRAFDEARRGNLDLAARAEAAAVRELALTDRGVLAPEDLDVYEDVAIRVAASRWATEPEQKPAGKRAVEVVFAPRGEGETCVRVVQTAGKARTLGERCTYGLVWKNALRWAPSGGVATIAVQPLAAWTEVWILRSGGDGAWTIDTLTPATADPDSAVGYVEAAGFSPDSGRVLVVREARGTGQATRRFQIVAAATLTIDKWAAHADKLSAFKRWSSPSWRAGTLALR